MPLFRHHWTPKILVNHEQKGQDFQPQSLILDLSYLLLPLETLGWFCVGDIGIKGVFEEGMLQLPFLITVFDCDGKLCRHITGACLAQQLMLLHLRTTLEKKESKGNI